MKHNKQTRLEYNGVYVNQNSYLVENKKGEIIKEFGTLEDQPVLHSHSYAVECWIYILTKLKNFTGAMVYPYTGAKIHFEGGKPILQGRPAIIPDEFPPLRILAGSLFNYAPRIKKTQGVLNYKNQ